MTQSSDISMKPKRSPCFAVWYDSLESFKQFMNRQFRTLGYSVGSHPLRYMLCCTLLALSCGAGFVNLKVERRQERLWTPASSDYMVANEYMLNHYNDAEPFSVLLTTNGDSRNIVSVDNFNTLWDLHDDVSSSIVSDGYTMGKRHQ